MTWVRTKLGCPLLVRMRTAEPNFSLFFSLSSLEKRLQKCLPQQRPKLSSHVVLLFFFFVCVFACLFVCL